jgi:hypothetical protein
VINLQVFIIIDSGGTLYGYYGMETIQGSNQTPQ